MKHHQNCLKWKIEKPSRSYYFLTSLFLLFVACTWNLGAVWQHWSASVAPNHRRGRSLEQPYPHVSSHWPTHQHRGRSESVLLISSVSLRFHSGLHCFVSFPSLVDAYISLEGEGFMEMRVKHLEKMGELAKAVVLAKACTECCFVSNQATFRQTYVSLLCHLLPNEEAIMEVWLCL